MQGLIDAGMAYEVDGDVYFRVNKFPAYGELSKQKISELRSGARVDVNEKKEDPLDFALWKKEQDGNFWKVHGDMADQVGILNVCNGCKVFGRPN